MHPYFFKRAVFNFFLVKSLLNLKWFDFDGSFLLPSNVKIPIAQ